MSRGHRFDPCDQCPGDQELGPGLVERDGITVGERERRWTEGTVRRVVRRGSYGLQLCLKQSHRRGAIGYSVRGFGVEIERADRTNDKNHQEHRRNQHLDQAETCLAREMAAVVWSAGT